MKNDAREASRVYLQVAVNQRGPVRVIEGMAPCRTVVAIPLATVLAACGGPNSSAQSHPSVRARPDPVGTRVFQVDSLRSTVAYTVTEHVPTISQFHPQIGTFRVTGSAPVMGGSIHITPDPSASAVRAVKVDPLRLKTDIGFRDSNINPMLTSAAGLAEFASTSVSGLPSQFPLGPPIKFKLRGQMQIHGIVRPLDFDVTASLTADLLEADATSHFDMNIFQVSPPSGIASAVDPEVTLVVHVVAHR